MGRFLLGIGVAAAAAAAAARADASAWIAPEEGQKILTTALGARVCGLAGRSLGATGFVNVELAGRVLDEGCPTGRLSLSAGFRPRENWLALGEVFSKARARAPKA
jgi:hypothetical protein